MINSLINWFDNRTGIKGIINETLYEPVPGGARWRYVWGSTLVFTFSLQMITGIFLWTAYSPGAQSAWESVYYIQHEMWLGNIVRGIHHFAAQAMVVLLAIHLMQVIIDGAYKAPREVNFWLGLILMQIVLGLSLTGYLLPWDQKGYYATQVSTKIMGATPVVGRIAQDVAQGGPEYGHHTLTRFFAMHAGILPGLLIAFLALHIYVFRRHGIKAHSTKGPTVPFWPDQVLKDAVACLGVFAVVLGLAVFKGAELSSPANPSESYAAARPEWYFLFLFRFLKFEAVEHFGLAFGSIYVPGAMMGVLVAMPIIAMKWRKGHTFNVAFMWAVTAAIVVLTGMAIVEDNANEDHQAAIAEAHRDADRVVELARRETRIPTDGAVKLLAQDSFTQGPRLFAKHCASCHRFDGHDGRGRMLREQTESGEQILAMPEATDLGKFANRKWMRSIVVNYDQHFAPLKFSARYLEGSRSDEIEYIDPDNSEMTDWSGNRDSLRAAENQSNVDALVEYLVSLADHTGTEVDPAKVDKGKSIALEGTWGGDLEGTSCVDCHSTLGEDFAEDESADNGGYPDIAQYGSKAWLKAFIRHPESGQFYGAKNQMPSFANKMSDTELDLLVEWMTGGYSPTEVEVYEDRSPEIAEQMTEKLAASGPSQ